MIRWLHLVSAAVWTGGLITLSVAVVALRKASADRTQLQAVGRAFGKLFWAAMGVLVITGVAQVIRLPDGFTSPRGSYGRLLFIKLLLVGLVAALALFHQMTAATTSAKTRGLIQGLILVLSLAIFWVAVQL